MNCDICNKPIKELALGRGKKMCGSTECWKQAGKDYIESNKGGNDPTARKTK